MKAGYQEPLEKNNLGLTLGIERRIKNLYLGYSSGYYFNYFNHNAYFQIMFPGKELFSFRTTYKRINPYNLLTLGVHYSFMRNNKY